MKKRKLLSAICVVALAAAMSVTTFAATNTTKTVTPVAKQQRFERGQRPELTEEQKANMRTDNKIPMPFGGARHSGRGFKGMPPDPINNTNQ